MTEVADARPRARWRPRGLLLQAALLILVGGVAVLAAVNVAGRFAGQTEGLSFDFLGHASGFAINQTLIDYDERYSNARVLLVGILNTLLVTGIGIVLATLLGFVMGVARLSRNWLIARAATVYVELMRNLPPLFHILFWYIAVLRTLPNTKSSLAIGDAVFLNIRGLYLPRPVVTADSGAFAAGVALALLAALVLAGWLARRGRGRAGLAIAVAAVVCAGAALWLRPAGAAIGFELPHLRGFNYAGGLRLIPELMALVLGLSIYTGAFIAEIVRAGILAVGHGQTEAAYSLGLRRGPTLRLIVIPQAMRLIVPPLTSQYLNLFKNSSLAIAIGYPDLVAVFAGPSLVNSGQAIQVIGITMLFYLAVSLATSALMNWYNARVALVER
jgi:general L-amino acid transport system permease protein